jgi:hypothetical protein
MTYQDAELKIEEPVEEDRDEKVEEIELAHIPRSVYPSGCLHEQHARWLCPLLTAACVGSVRPQGHTRTSWLESSSGRGRRRLVAARR